VVPERLRRAAVLQRLHGFVGVHVAVAHEPARLVGADRQQRQRQARMALAHALEGGAVAKAAVADAVELLGARLQNEACPQRVAAIRGSASRPVLAGLDVHGHATAEVDGGIPVHGLRRQSRHGRLQDGVVAERRDNQGTKALPQPADRGHVHVVIVVVRDEDAIDLGQRVEGDPAD